MRVGLVCPYSFDVHGGVQSHVRGLAGTLAGLGHDVSVLAPGEESAELPPYVTTTGRAVPLPYNGSVARVSFGPLVAGRVRRWLDRGRFDVVHIHEPATPSVSVLALWAATGPVVATYHTAQSRPRALETSAATFLRAGLDKISAHIVVSEEARETLACYQDVEPVQIPNGVHTRRFARPRWSRPQRPRTGPVLAFVGRVDEPRKGLSVLLEAMPLLVERCPEVRLVVVGAGSRRVTRDLAPDVRRRVEFLGAVSEEQKAEVLAGADLFVAPNTGGESFGIVLVEALAAGLPLLASDLPAFRRLAAEGGGATFRNGDPADLADKAVAMLSGAARQPPWSRATAAAQRYDWSVVAPQVAEVYRSAVAGPGVVGLACQ